MSDRLIPPFRPGDPMRVGPIEQLRQQVQGNRLDIAGNVSGRQGPMGSVVVPQTPDAGTLSQVAKAGSGGVSARSGTTPGSGTVTLQKISGGLFVSDGTVTVYSFCGSAVGANKYIWVAQDRYGVWWVPSEDCV